MEWSVLFMGPVGAGKTQAIRTISEIDVVTTDVGATDETRKLKDETTVSMDLGVIHLGEDDKLRLYGAPGQDRFDFMWEILLEQVKGVILILNHANPDPVADLAHYIKALTVALGRRKIPLVIGVSHVDERMGLPLSIYLDYLKSHPVPFVRGAVPVYCMDARVLESVKCVLMMMTGMLEMNERIQYKAS